MALPFSAQTSNLRIRIFFPVFAIACLASLGYVFARPAVYLSTARLQFEAPPGQRQDGEGDYAFNLLTAGQTLTSSTLLDQVRQRLSNSDPGVAAAIGGVEALHRMLSVAPVEGTNVIELRGEGSDRQLLLPILSAWIEAYRESHRDAFERASTAGLEHMRSAVEQLRQNLENKRRDTEQFRKKFDIVSLEREENQAMSQLKGLNTALNDARNREVNAEARVNAIRGNVAAGRSGDQPIIANLERRAMELRERAKDLEHDYTPQYLALDPKYKALRANLVRLEQQIESERRANAQQTLQGAEEELAGARQAMQRLQQQFTERKREVQDFTTRFAEHTALTNQVRRLEELYDTGKERLTRLEMEKKAMAPKVTVLSPPSVPDRPLSPDYWRDALLGVAGSGMLGLIAVWMVEFLRRSGAPRREPVVQPIIHISYPPQGIAFDGAMPILPVSARRLPETIVQFPRELSVPEVHALWAAATSDARLVIAGLLGGFSLEELAALRYRDIDPEAACVRTPGADGRSCTLRDPLRRLLIERRAAKGGDTPFVNAHGESLAGTDLEGLIACAACDAGLAKPAEVTSEALRHTYFAYLIRQGARLADIGEFIGHIPPAAFREYGLLSPPGPGLPLEQIDPVFPALRAQ